MTGCPSLTCKGECLETANGTTTVERKFCLDGIYRVYNLEVEVEVEVEGDRECFITSDAVRVHNCPEALSGSGAWCFASLAFSS